MLRKLVAFLFFSTACCLLFSAAAADAQRYPYGAPPPPPGPYDGPPSDPYDGPGHHRRHREQVIFNNGNIDAVQNGPSRRTRFSIDRPTFISFIQNYHYYNYGHGPGAISLRGLDGTRYGPWPAEGEQGQGGVPNAYWNCYPNITLPPGTYVIEDSDPGTWSQNAGSEFRGISMVRGRPVY